MALSIMGICGLLFVGGIALWIFSFRLFKKDKKYIALILAIVGILLFIPPTYLIYRIVPFLVQNNSFGGYEYAKEFTQINHGFSERYVSRKRTVVGINLEINGFVNGKGELLIQSNENTEGILFILEGNVYEKLYNKDWYVSECLIEFIPENEFVEGKILIKIDMY